MKFACPIPSSVLWACPLLLQLCFIKRLNQWRAKSSRANEHKSVTRNGKQFESEMDRDMDLDMGMEMEMEVKKKGEKQTLLS